MLLKICPKSLYLLVKRELGAATRITLQLCLNDILHFQTLLSIFFSFQSKVLKLQNDSIQSLISHLYDFLIQRIPIYLVIHKHITSCSFIRTGPNFSFPFVSSMLQDPNTHPNKLARLNILTNLLNKSVYIQVFNSSSRFPYTIIN